MLLGGLNSNSSGNRILISHSERQYITQGILENIRLDGRSRLEWRSSSSLKVELDPIPQAAGSARIRYGGTDVLVSIKGDIGRPGEEIPEEGSLICTVDTSSLLAMNMVSGGAAVDGGGGAGGAGLGGNLSAEDRQIAERNAELGTILYDLLVKSGGINLRKFCLVPGKHCWILYVDVLVLEYAGNLVDVMMMATRLAFSRMNLPVVRIEESGEATEIALAEEVDENKRIGLEDLPTAITVVQIKEESSIGDTLQTSFLIDPSTMEEVCTDAALIVGCIQRKPQINEMIDDDIIKKEPSQGICLLRKLGNGWIDPGMIGEYIKVAQEASLSFNALIQSTIMI